MALGSISAKTEGADKGLQFIACATPIRYITFVETAKALV